jgi:hypothetical protein
MLLRLRPPGFIEPCLPSTAERLTDTEFLAIANAAQALCAPDRDKFYAEVARELQGREIGDGAIVAAQRARIWIRPICRNRRIAASIASRASPARSPCICTLQLGLPELGFNFGQFLRKPFGPFDIAALFSLLHEPTQSLGQASQIKYAHSQRVRACDPVLMFKLCF